MPAPTSFTELLFTYAFCNVVSSIVLKIDGDGRHGGGGDNCDSLHICPGLFGHV